MTKFLTKRFMLIGALALVLIAGGITLLLTGQKDNHPIAPNGSLLPLLSSPDDIFFQGTGFSLTYSDVYEEFKSNDGINQLLFMIDSELLKTRISSFSQEVVDNKIKFLKYATSDDEKIAEISEEDIETFDRNYLENMFLLGYQNNEEAYVRMLLAKEELAREMILDPANAEKTWYLSDAVIAADYTSNIFNDIQAIKIRFFSETDAKNILTSLNLVSFQNDLRLYIGTKPLQEVSSLGLNTTNTRVLTSDEVLLYYIKMYNIVYGAYLPLIDEASTVEDILENDTFTQIFSQQKAIQSSLANYMFNSLASIDEFALNPSKSYYSTQPIRYALNSSDTSHYMVLKLSSADKVNLTSYNPTTSSLATLITQELYDELKEAKIQSYLNTQGFVAERISEYRQAQGLQVLDYYLGVDYKSVFTSYEVNKVGSKTLVATLSNGFSITADDLLTFALEKNGALYSVYAAQLQAVIHAHFAEIYCRGVTTTCEFSLGKDRPATVSAHFTELEELKKQYAESYYAIYYTFAEYIYLAYGAKSDADMVQDYYVKSKLQPFLIHADFAKDNYKMLEDLLYPFVEEYFNNYFSLNARTLLIFVDRNEDAKPDNFTSFIEELGDRTAFDALIADFETAIRNYITEKNAIGFGDVVSVYNAARRNDPIWGVFKQQGLALNLGNPSSSGSITYLNTKDQFEKPLVEAFQATYALYNTDTNRILPGYHYQELVETSLGLYFVYAEKGTNFTKPSAKFTMTYTNNIPNYTIGTENELDIPSLEQLKLFALKRFYEIGYGTASDVETKYGITIPILPTSLITALEAYFTPLHDAIYVVGHLNMIVSDVLLAGTYINSQPSYSSKSNIEMHATLEAIKNLYYQQVFSKYINE
ncbi:MAG: hypothetical protein U1C51_08200 [Candidatus Izemoplasmatales bacterium]|nr:hypothetical protein [Candidatus Izemoplasmatales bacterium]